MSNHHRSAAYRARGLATSCRRHVPALAVIGSLCTALVVAACGSKSDTACPAGTKEYLQQDRQSPRKRRLCLLEDGITTHGPIVDIDEHGRETLVGRVDHGKRDGHWRERDVEGFYRNGYADGLYVMRQDGRKWIEQEFRDGHPHGKRAVWNTDGSIRDLEHYDNGKPAGEWQVYANGATERRVYGPQGVLLSVDGREVPAPPAEIVLSDGKTLTRLECVRRAEAFRWTGAAPDERLCLPLFEEVQRCGDEECRRAAVARFGGFR